jgi:hypothetical protein
MVSIGRLLSSVYYLENYFKILIRTYSLLVFLIQAAGDKEDAGECIIEDEAFCWSHLAHLTSNTVEILVCHFWKTQLRSWVF